MENMFKKATSANSNKELKVYSNRLITVEDLFNFKLQLLSEIQTLLKGNPEQKTKKWLRSYQVRKLLNISPGTLQNLKSSGVIPYSKIGGVHYYDSDEIHQLLESGKSSKR
jgi:hypothetical protein